VRKINSKDCSLCYCNIYNSGNGKCFQFKDATLSKGRVLSIDALPKDYAGKFKLIPDCYRRQRYFVQREGDR
jgi:hypothetical protein